MKTSVVVCTFNGERFIVEQLKSIHLQTVQADEVIIQDDCSSDRTRELIECFISENNLQTTWTLNCNEKNLGWKKNFMSAISKAEGDLIFLSDQDDIWYPDKIEKMSRICADNPCIELLFSELEAFDDGTGEKVKIYQPIYGTSGTTKVPLEKYFAECGRQGCTYAISRILIKYIDALWQEDWPHDGFLWCICLSRGTLYSYNEPLVHYRRHSMASSPSNEKSVAVRSRLLERYSSIGRMLLKNKELLGISNDNEQVIREATEIYSARAESVKSRNVIKLIFLLRYLSFYPRPKAWVGDLISTIR